jgi:hypothetical protein
LYASGGVPGPVLRAPCDSAYPTFYVGAAANYVPPSPIVWGGRAGALLLFRNDANYNFFSYDSAAEAHQLLDARDAFEELMPGVEARIVRFDLCSRRGVEAIYWGLYPSETLAYAHGSSVSGDLNAILNFDQLNYNGIPASAYVNDAVVHRLRGVSEVHNVEINRLWGMTTACGCSPWSAHILAGFRYFDFDERLEFAADTTDGTFSGAPNELYYTIDAENNLYGGQMGMYAERCLAPRWFARCGAKAGVFANDASSSSTIGGAAGVATVNNGPNAGRAWRVTASELEAAFLGELRAALAWQPGAHWRLTAEYRVLAASGVAQPAHQIFHDLRGLQDAERLAANGDVFLHGVFVGGEWQF